MNYIDIGVLVILGLFVLQGFFKSFISSLLSLASNVVSLVGAAIAYPIFSNILNATGLLAEVLKYAEGAERVNSYALSIQPISQFAPAQLNSVLDAANLPIPMDNAVRVNIGNQAFGDASIGTYLNDTIAYVAINILAFFIAFLIIRAIVGIVVSALKYAAIIPGLGHSLPVLSGAIGFVRGILFLFLLFMLTPLLLSIFPEQAQSLLDGSFFANFFYQSNFLFAFIAPVV